MTAHQTLDTLSRSYQEDFLKLFQAQPLEKDASLLDRKRWYQEHFNDLYQQFRSETSERVLESKDSFEIMKYHTAWIDGWICFTWQFVMEEMEIIIGQFSAISKEQLSYLESAIPSLNKQIEDLKNHLYSQTGERVPMDPAEHSYYQNTLKEQLQRLSKMEHEQQTLREVIPQIPKAHCDEIKLGRTLLVFARGGYGREELGFSSDFDIGFCLDPTESSNLEIQLAEEFVKRMEELLRETSIDMAFQYFELGEDLSRFSKPEMMHTIPSILEGRPIQGAFDNMQKLKQELFVVRSQERIIRFFQKQMEQLQPEEGNDLFHIKNGYGGLRHLQFALWIAQVIFRQDSGNSKRLLSFLRKEKVISINDEGNLKQAVEFYNDLRNFFGLKDCYKEELLQRDAGDLISHLDGKQDLLDDRSCMAYLKLKNRFLTIDFMDRYRLQSIRSVARISKTIVEKILDRTETRKLPGFLLVKHLGSNQIIQFQPPEEQLATAWNLKFNAQITKTPKYLLNSEGSSPFFLNLGNLFQLFLHIAGTGDQLSSDVIGRFSILLPKLYSQGVSENRKEVRKFLYRLFIEKQSSEAVRQMIEISTPVSHEGNVQTLLGLFLPEVNQMRYLLRNIEVHEYPLCVHSIKSLAQVEEEIENNREKEPELWRFISEEDIFALKWSTFFHDVGKTNPYRDHEELGAILAVRMLTRFGWDGESETLDLIRLLVRHHQSVVRYSQISTFLDVGIRKFFELADRSPRIVILLYLINLSDFKSVNSTMYRKTANLEKFYEKTLNILEAFRSENLSGSITEIVNDYLNSKVEETRKSVLQELLLRQCCNKSLKEVVLNPLEELSEKRFIRLKRHEGELEKLIHFLELSELDRETLDRYRIHFNRLIGQILSEKDIVSMISPRYHDWNWFFTVIPNRFLVSSTSEVLASQFLHFMEYRSNKIRFSFVKGNPGEYDTVLFYCEGDLNVQTKIAYALGRLGINIENGKINRVAYLNGEKAVAGFLQVSYGTDQTALSEVDLEMMISTLTIPMLNLASRKEGKESSIQLNTFHERKKGYLVQELEENSFQRVNTDFIAIKISMYDDSFQFFKLMKAFDFLKMMPQQITVTTIGEQIIDYFYFSTEDQDKINSDDFRESLERHLNSEFSIA